MKIKFTSALLSCHKHFILLIANRSFIFLFCGTVFATTSENSWSQNVKIVIDKDRTITVDEVFDLIDKQTGYSFVYKSDIFNNLPPVQLKKGTISLRKLLQISLQSKDIAITIKDNKTIVIEKSVKSKHQNNIRGKVTDEFGKPLPGVNVYEKGTINGTTTNFDGEYVLVISSKNPVLVFSFIGFETKEVEVIDQKELNIVLKESVFALSSIVVTALGIKKETKALTYNVQELKPESLTDGGQGNIINSLSGKIAGVDIQSSSGGVGVESRVILRGTSSINGNNNALYVVDGIPVPDLTLGSARPGGFYGGRATSFGGLSMLNTEDIESISVLTGAAAAALYGTQAANGVILLNTKKGTEGLKVSISNNLSLMNPFVTPKFQNTYGTSEPGSMFSWGGKLAASSDYNPIDFFQTGTNKKTSISLSTGTETNKFYFSSSMQDAEGIIPNNEFNRFNLTINNSSTFLDDMINLDVSVNYIKQEDKNIILQGQYQNPLVPIYLFPPGDDIDKYRIYERINPERNITTQYWPYGDQGLALQNPFWITNRTLFANSIDRYLIGATLKFNIMEGLSVTGRARLDNSNMKFTEKLYASTYQLFAGPFGAYSVAPSRYQQIYADLVASYNKRFNKIGIEANIGTSIKDDQHESTSVRGDLNQIANFFTLGGLSQSKTGVGEGGFHDQAQSIFSNISINHDNKIFMEASGRIDWPSQLYGATQESFFYPSIGASAIITDLLNVKSDIFSFVKIRGSYSEVGNAPPRYTTTLTYPLSGGQVSNTTIRPTKNIEPERTESVEVGVDLRLFKGKVSFNGTLYKARTYNQLFTPNLSTSSGFNSFYLNAGEVENKGIEASLSWKGDMALAGKLKLNSTATFSLNKNKVVKLVKDYVDEVTGETITEDRLVFGATGSYRTILTEGGTMGDIYVNTLKKDGQGFIFVNPDNAKILAEPDNFIKAGTSLPHYRLGWRNELSYKDVTLSFLVNARVGGVGVSQTQAILDHFGVSQASADARENGGIPINSSNYTAKDFYQVVGSPQAGVGAYYVYDMTNVRLRELSLSYKLNLPKISFLDRMQFGISGYNLLMIYNKAPFDPESTSSIGTFYQGIDYFMQPSLRSISCNVKLEF